MDSPSCAGLLIQQHEAVGSKVRDPVQQDETSWDAEIG
jgi:hypothetical protein